MCLRSISKTKLNETYGFQRSNVATGILQALNRCFVNCRNGEHMHNLSDSLFVGACDSISPASVII